MDAFPSPTIDWQKGTDPITVDNKKYSQTMKKEGLIHFSAELTIIDVGESDYGEYHCKASNAEGFDKHTIILGGTSKLIVHLFKKW